MLTNKRAAPFLRFAQLQALDQDAHKAVLAWRLCAWISAIQLAIATFNAKVMSRERLAFFKTIRRNVDMVAVAKWTSSKRWSSA